MKKIMTWGKVACLSLGLLSLPVVAEVTSDRVACDVNQVCSSALIWRL